MDKSLIRKQILSIRSNLRKNDHIQMSNDIVNKLMASEFYKNARNIMTYISFQREIDTHEFIKRAINDNKNILVPITLEKDKQLKPSHIKSFDELEIGFYNILTPKEEFIRYVDPNTIDLIIVPGLGFDHKGYRVGFGGGYYDRFLSKLKDIPKISIAFDFQVLDQVPKESFDIPVDYIFTDKRIINCR